MSDKVCIIAEAGVNHNGDLNLAIKLVNEAMDVGADFVKFQTFKAEDIVTKNAERAEYQKNNTNDFGSQFDMLKKLELSDEDHIELIKYCKKKNIKFLSTPFSIKSAQFLFDQGLDTIKIASGEITNIPLLEFIALKKWKIIFSTGMSSLGEVERALNILTRNNPRLEKCTVLHCTSEYPTPMSDVNLMAMSTISDAFGVTVGLSDHTKGIHVPIAAVAMGAKVIEKHFTLDRSLPGPDHTASLEPKEFRKMVEGIRDIEKALGNKIKGITQSEEANKLLARKSIVANQIIRSGEVLTIKNITTKRPGDGISASEWHQVLGKVASRRYEPDDQIDF